MTKYMVNKDIIKVMDSATIHFEIENSIKMIKRYRQQKKGKYDNQEN